MPSLKRVILERLRWLIRWFFPRTASSQTASSQTASSQTDYLQPAYQLLQPLLKHDYGIEMTQGGYSFDELPFRFNDEDDYLTCASNPSSVEIGRAHV
jgi:hypothetical protein